jgi:hypothetical protein
MKEFILIFLLDTLLQTKEIEKQKNKMNSTAFSCSYYLSEAGAKSVRACAYDSDYVILMIVIKF